MNFGIKIPPVTALCLLALFLFPPPSAAHEFYVSPRGSDTNPGTLARPFHTLQRARGAIRILRREQRTSGGPTTVYLRGGMYTLTEPFVLQPEDGGSPTSPVIYSAYHRETPVVSGGKVIQGWEEKMLNGRRVWMASLPLVSVGELDLHELWVNGERRVQSRYPRKGYLRVASVPDVTPQTDWLDGQLAFRAGPGDLPAGETFLGAEAVVMNRWVESRLPVVAFERDSSLLRFSKRTMFRLEEGDPYYFENVRGALNEAGEWLVDRQAGALYYLPRKGEKRNAIEAVIPYLTNVLWIEGRPDSGRFVEHLKFQGISFAYTGWHFPAGFRSESRHPDAGGFVQAAIGVPAAIVAEGMRACSFEDCTVTHMGTYGIEIAKGCAGNRISRCNLYDLGGGGIKIGETVMRDDTLLQTSGNTVADCSIYNGGRVFHSAIGIWIGQSGGNRLVHNHIHDFYYTGISIGWTWGYGPSLAKGNIVELNHVDHIGALGNGDGPILSDMGGIYTLGIQPGTVIRQNVFHDIAGLRYGGWGIYFDEGSTHIVAEGNLVYRTTHGGFHQHYGRENIFRNNILALGRDFQIVRSRLETHVSFAFEHNIVYWRGGRLLGGNPRGGNFVFDNNLYWNGRGDTVRFDSLTFPAWQSLGNDVHSRVADPLFRNPEGGDFRIRPGSPSATIRFHPIPIEKILSKRPVESEITAPRSPLRRRVLYNSDGSNIFWRDTLTPKDVYRCVDEVGERQVTTFLFNPNPGQNTIYPSRVTRMYYYDFPKGMNAPVTSWDSMGKKFSDHLQRLMRDSLDPVGMIVDRIRLRGMEAFLTVRMNELHDVDRPGSPLLSDFWKSHPEYRVGGYAGWGSSALNYGEPEVQEYYFALLKEICERYPIDGLELDFMRFPYYFPYDSSKTETYAAIMTGFVERVRRMTHLVGRTRGLDILLAARVPSSLKACRYVGLDPGTWSKRGLVDFVTVAPFLSTEPDMPIGEFKRVCGDIPVYAGLEYTCGSRMMTVEEIRAASALFYSAGADGIYSFNYFCSRAAGQEPDFSVFDEIGNPDSLKRLEKLYALAEPKYPIPNVSLPAALPLALTKGESREVRMQTAEHQAPHSALLRIECRDSVSTAALQVSFNGARLSGGSHPSREQIFVRKVLYKPAPAPRCLEFIIDPGVLQRNNTLRLTARERMTVEWIYLAVRP